MKGKSLTFYAGFYQKSLIFDKKQNKSLDKSSETDNKTQVNSMLKSRSMKTLTFSAKVNKNRFPSSKKAPTIDSCAILDERQTHKKDNYTSTELSGSKIARMQSRDCSSEKSNFVEQPRQNLALFIKQNKIGMQISKYRPTRQLIENNPIISHKPSNTNLNTVFDFSKKRQFDMFKNQQVELKSQKQETVLFNNIDTFDFQKSPFFKQKVVSDIDPIKMKLKYAGFESMFGDKSVREAGDSNINKRSTISGLEKTNCKRIVIDVINIQTGLKLMQKLFSKKLKKTYFLNMKKRLLMCQLVFRVAKIFNAKVYKFTHIFVKNVLFKKKIANRKKGFEVLKKVAFALKMGFFRVFIEKVNCLSRKLQRLKIKRMKISMIKEGFSKISKIIKNCQIQNFGFCFEIFLKESKRKRDKKNVAFKDSIDVITSVLANTRKGFLRNSLKLFRQNSENLNTFHICLKKLEKFAKSDLKLCFRKFRLINHYSKKRFYSNQF